MEWDQSDINTSYLWADFLLEKCFSNSLILFPKWPFEVGKAIVFHISEMKRLKYKEVKAIFMFTAIK